MATRTEAGMPLGIPSERDAALAKRAGRALEPLIERTEPISARFGDETVDIPAPAGPSPDSACLAVAQAGRLR